MPINYIMDEFSNLGQIPDFVRKISTVRSRNINITIIIQNIAQLKNRYPNDQWQEILGCCDIKIFLGCTDMMTAEYISDVTGIATIEVESTNSTYDRQIMIFNQDTDYHEVKSRGQRKVMNKDEVLRMKNTDELILLRCQKPILCQKFDYTLHPESKNFIKSSPADHIPEWRRKRMEEEAENRKKAEEIMKEAKLQTERKVEEYRNNREKYMQDIRNDEYKNCITATERSEVAEKAKVVQLSPKDSKDKQRTDAFIKDFFAPTPTSTESKTGDEDDSYDYDDEAEGIAEDEREAA